MAAKIEFLLLPEETGLYPEGAQSLQEGPDGSGNSGIDILFPRDMVIRPGEKTLIDLRVRVVCLRTREVTWKVSRFGPGGGRHDVQARAFFLLPRSSISKSPLIMLNGVGLIDMGYRGNLKVAVQNLDPLGSDPFHIKKGTALFQIAATNLAPPDYEVLKPDDPRAETYFGENATNRGEGGFGSTGASGSAGSAETAEPAETAEAESQAPPGGA